MFNLAQALRTPGQIVLIDKRHVAGLLDLPPASAGRSGESGVLARLAQAVGLARGDDDERPATGAALPLVPWADAVEPAEGYVIVDGVAIIDVAGVLTRQGYYDYWSECFVGGYEQIGQSLRLAAEDDRVRGIFMRVCSPGGFSDGCFELAADILAMSARKGGKPIWVHTWMACSAAYALACSADRVIAAAGADVGSIGVYVMMLDASGWLATEGLKIEAIQSGAHKTSGGFWKPLTDDERADFQAVVDQVARDFVATVTLGRGLSAAAITAQEARWYLAQHDDPARSGLKLGLVDAIASERDAFALLHNSLSPATGDGAPGAPGLPSNADKETTMTLAEQIAALKTKADGGDAAAKTELETLQAQFGAAPRAGTTTDDGDDEENDDDPDDKKEPEAKATGTKAGFALLATKEAIGREKLARALGARVASNALTYGEAKALLAASPKSGRLAEAMNGRDQNPGADAGSEGQRNAGQSGWAKAVAKQNARRGVKAA